MASSIGNLVVSLTANTSRFVSGMQRATRSMRRMSERVGRVTRRVAAFGAAMSAAAVAGLGVMVKRQLQTIDELAKLSDRIGIATEDLQALQHAATLTGVESQTLSRALEAFSRRLGDAAAGTGEAKAALDRLGISADELIDLPMREQLGIIADRMANLRSQSERTALASDLFSRAGISLVNTLQGGSEALDAMTEEARRLGLTLNRVDASAVERANDSMARASAALRGIAQRITVAVAPVVELLAQKFSNAAASAGITSSTIVSGMEAASKAVARLADFTELLTGLWHGLRFGVNAAISDLLRLASGLGKIKPLLESLPNIGPSIKALPDSLFELEGLTAAADRFGERAEDAMARADKSFRRFAEGVNAANVEETFAKWREALLNQQIGDRLDNFFDSVAEGSQRAAAGIRDAAEATFDFGTAVGGVQGVFGRVADFIGNAVDRLGGGMQFEPDRTPGGVAAVERGTSAAASAIAASRRAGPERETAKNTASMDKKLSGLSQDVQQLARQLADEGRPLLVSF